ncbi:hsdR [Serratia fonticola]|uniref:hsdR n=1 Tax=Serratia fonticola TaxID=47917 RepID=UPI0034C5E776
MLYGKDDKGPRLSQDTEALISNGLDFLNKAREELQAGQAKFSVVSFWTAVEILMKVPLVNEHWTLACSGKKMERRKYLAGDFQSVTYDEACARLGDVLEKPLEKKTADLFNKVKNHRNRVVHFYHNELSEGDQQQVLTEQADAWFALNRLIHEDWSSLFGRELRRKLAEDETRMLQISEFYAGAKFRHESVQEELSVEIRGGASISECPVCGYAALLKQMLIPEISLYDKICLVCDEQDIFLDLDCPQCGEAVMMKTGDDDFKCGSCGYESSRYEAFNPTPVDERDESDAAGCSNCLRIDSVCFFKSLYHNFICTDCFNTHEYVEQCERCLRWGTDVPARSLTEGCIFCSTNKHLREAT